jgi:hypothetical protein
MTKVWLTYAWDDNLGKDVEFIAQELSDAGLTVLRDKWDLKAGRRLWTQIDAAITDPNKSDAWLIYATQNSLTSSACQEELAYALDRALKIRGEEFPILALFPGDVGESLIPGAIRTRLYVATTNDDWVELIVAGAEGRVSKISRPRQEPFDISTHKGVVAQEPFVIEMRPRAGFWAPFMYGIPAAEADRVKPRLTHGAHGVIPEVFMLAMSDPAVTSDGKWVAVEADSPATPTMSYYLHCAELPSEILFGVSGDGSKQWVTKPPPPH